GVPPFGADAANCLWAASYRACVSFRIARYCSAGVAGVVWAGAAASGRPMPRASSVPTLRVTGDTSRGAKEEGRSLLDHGRRDATSMGRNRSPGRLRIAAASTGGRTDRIRPSVAHALPKYVMGTGLV